MKWSVSVSWAHFNATKLAWCTLPFYLIVGLVDWRLLPCLAAVDLLAFRHGRRSA